MLFSEQFYRLNETLSITKKQEHLKEFVNVNPQSPKVKLRYKFDRLQTKLEKETNPIKRAKIKEEMKKIKEEIIAIEKIERERERRFKEF